MTPSTATALPFLLGSFDGQEHMYASTWADAGPATSTIEGRAELGGSVVVQRYLQVRDGTPSFALLAVWMTDPATGEVLYYGFDSAGFPADPPARGTWQDTAMVLDRATPRGRSRLTVTAGEDGGWAWVKSFQAPGTEEWIPVQDAEFRPRTTPASSRAPEAAQEAAFRDLKGAALNDGQTAELAAAESGTE